ncbi:urea ABC transporter substrate-binding protein [Aeromicrobium duanguangcaii]|uniref:Urea ABC transporter substrate-binding protein n=1 Tax=Aeromicrobium duanguangcaii TaxID=2968086 RepID=A0ABY5KBP5_9ACTN|nr:urea ABC transporter substrate-binding protein [Aeromicrobium duanguangcaii]MCD9154858.1 urea ABC transporter substrate-binding protein [Aeromicrobium duanguangcaii]UUI67730.1 urea ABC transporter substrate-binding protein [Aeromicrobium duanguangcaii]
MKTRKLITSTAAVMAAALVLTGCGTKSDDGESASSAGCVDTSGDSVKLGFLNSLSGTMAISEVTVSNSLKLAAEEINADGGILGKQIEIVQEDGASEPDIFAEKAKKLIQDDCVAAVFGGWTSSSRKAMLPVFESLDNLLFYPVQYEGLEASDNIFYTGATTNQQILPGLEYLKAEKKIKTLFLVGSDYVFPRTANDEIKQWAAANDVEVLGEEYQPLGEAEWGPAIDKITKAKPDAVFNTINGDSNVAFFKAYFDKGLSKTPVISVSIAEEEVAAMGADLLEGQLTAWNYYQTLDTPANTTFVAAYKAKYGKDKPTSDPMEAAYTSLYLYKEMVEKAESFKVPDIQEAADGVTFEAPEGLVTIDGDNHHITKTGRIGEVQPNGLIDTVWESDGPIDPDPFLEGYDWYKKSS